MAKVDYLSGLKSGDKKTFKNIFEEYYPSLVLFAIRYLKSQSQAEDIVQESFCKLWDHRKELHSENGIKSYLYTTVRNRSINLIRSLKIRDRHVAEIQDVEPTVDFESVFIEEESLRLFYAVLEELSESQKLVIKKTIEGYNREEIAKMMNLSVDTVKYHKTKAFNYLRERLNNNIYLLFILSRFLGL